MAELHINDKKYLKKISEYIKDNSVLTYEDFVSEKFLEEMEDKNERRNKKRSKRHI